MEIWNSQTTGLYGVNPGVAEQSKDIVPEYKPSGIPLAEREMTDLVHIDNYISSLRSLSNDGRPENPKYDFYVQWDSTKMVNDRYGHKSASIRQLEAINQKTHQPRLTLKCTGDKIDLKIEYDENTGKMIKKTEYYGDNKGGRVYYYNQDGKCCKSEDLETY